VNITSTVRFAALACGVAILAGCGVNSEVNRDLDQAAREVTTQNLKLSARDDAVPKAEITPRDELLIGGKPVALTAAQQAQVHDYRQQTISIALEGIEIGRRGAEIGLNAAWPMAVKAIFGASDKDIERDMQEKLVPVHAAVAKLCDRLPTLMASEQQLAESLPAFQPYAKLTPEDISHCREDALEDTDVPRSGIGSD
jgi:hypothetical protein